MKIYTYAIALLLSSHLAIHTMNSVETKHLDFGPKGKAILQLALNNWHESSKRTNVHTGLASIYNATPATPAGVASLINDQGAQKNGSQYFAKFNDSGYKQTKEVLQNIANESYPNATRMADEASYKMALGIIYGSLHKTSDVHVPEDKMSQIFDDATSTMAHNEILKANKDIICDTKNKDAARGYLLLVAYLIQEGELYRFTLPNNATAAILGKLINLYQ